MSKWAIVQKLPEDFQKRISALYAHEQFPYEVRTLLAEWIESQPWDKIEPDNPEHEKFAASLVARLIQELTHFALSIENNSVKFKLDQVINYYTLHFAHDCMNLIRIYTQTLQNENNILESAQTYLQTLDVKPILMADGSIASNGYDDIYQELGSLRTQVQESEQLLRHLNQDQEQLILRIQERNKYSALVSNACNSPERTKMFKSLEQIEVTLRDESDNLMKSRGLLLDRCREVLNRAGVVQSRILDGELERWKRGQQLLGNGVPYNGFSLDEIQEFCENTAELVWQTRVHVKRQQMLCQSYSAPQYIIDSLYQLLELGSQLLVRMVKSTFVIEKQPPQVMKTNTRFTSTVRLLVGGKLNVHMTPPSVSVFIISEHQAAVLGAGGDSLVVPHNEAAAGEILNATGVMEYHAATRQLTVHFRNMQLKKIKRTEKKGTESVMDEKFALLFFSRFNVCAGELGDICVRTFSLPVVVIVHGNQEPHAHATITWDNAFAEPGRTSFAVPDKVPFIRVGDVLSQKFNSVVGLGLSDDNLRYLAAKALRSNTLPELSTPITWSQFSKEPLPDRSFTFWEWFYAILKLTKEHLKGLWADKTIIGFVWRKAAEEMLAQCVPGTFLLRFSDSELGGLTVAWKAKGPDGTTDEYYMLQPFTARDFAIRGLADRLSDLKHLTVLYPDIPKDQAFSKYYTPLCDISTKSGSGYVKSGLVTCVPGLPSHSYDSYPNTPQSTMHPHSPSDSNSGMHYDSSGMDTSMSTPVKFVNRSPTNHNGTNNTNSLQQQQQQQPPQHPVGIVAPEMTQTNDHFTPMLDLISVQENSFPMDFFFAPKH